MKSRGKWFAARCGRRSLALLLAAVMLTTALLTALPLSASAETATSAALKGKRALFIGDSIAAGWRDAVNGDYSNAGGWAKRIGDSYGMTVDLGAIAGYTFSNIRGSKRIVNELASYKSNTYDYVILQGGFNDAMGSDDGSATGRDKSSTAPIGTTAADFAPEHFDPATYAGGLEETLYKIKEFFPTAKVGYIVTYQTPLSTYGGYTAETTHMREQYATGMAICKKWGVDWLDLYDGHTEDGRSYSKDILKTGTTTYFPGGSDCIHLNSAGYDAIYPYIAEWMGQIDPGDTQDFESYPYVVGEDLALSGSQGSLVVSDAKNHTADGSRAILVTAKTSAGAARPQMTVRDKLGAPVKIEKGKSYTVSFAVYSETGGAFRYWLCATDSENIFASASEKDACKLYESSGTLSLPAGAWTVVTAALTDCAYAGNLRIGFGGVTNTSAASPAVYYVDDLAVAEKAAVQDYETNATVKTFGHGTLAAFTEQNHTSGGSRSLKLETSQSNGYYRKQFLLTAADGSYLQIPESRRMRDYVLSFWIYVPGSSAGELRFWLCSTDDTAVFTNTEEAYPKDKYVLYEMNSGDISAKDTWVQYRIAITAASWENCERPGPYLRLGVTSTGASTATKFICYIDDVLLEENSTAVETFENYDTATAVSGNGSGRELSAVHAHAGSGVDTTAGQSVRLKMNKTGDGNYARTVIRANGADAKFPIGVRYAVSFWAYWDPAESSLDGDKTVDQDRTSLKLSLRVGSVKDPAAVWKDTKGNEGAAEVVIAARQWQQFTVLTNTITGYDQGDGTTCLTLGAYFSGARDADNETSHNRKYLYVDDVSVRALDRWMNDSNVPGVARVLDGGLLYVNGADDQNGGTAVYWNEAKGCEYAAMRVEGRYTADNDNRMCALLGGVGYDIVERGLLLGDATATADTLAYSGSYIYRSGVSGARLRDCWRYDAATGEVRYTLLIKNIAKEQQALVRTFRSYLRLSVNGAVMTLYSPVYDISAQRLYEGYAKQCAAAGKTAPQWFGTFTGGEQGDTVSLLDGVDSRFRIVYAAGDAAAMSAAKELKAGIEELIGKAKNVVCVSDAEMADDGTYEILVGNTNRTADDDAATTLDGKDEKYDAAFLLRMNGRKLCLQAKKTGDTVKYAYTLGLAVEEFLESYAAAGIPVDLEYCSSQASEALGSTPLLTVGGTGSNLLNNAQIIVEKYPSYMTLAAAKDLQKAIARLSGQYIALVKYDGSVEHTTGVSLIVGPKQGAVKAIYGEKDTVYTEEEPAAPGPGHDDDSISLEPSGGKTGYLIGAQKNNLWTDGGVNGYQIAVDNRKWPDYTVQVNGGSPAAINAGVQALIQTLRADKNSGLTRTGTREEKSYTLSNAYGVAFYDEFEYSSAEEMKQNWTIDANERGLGATDVTEAYTAYKNTHTYAVGGTTYTGYDAAWAAYEAAGLGTKAEFEADFCREFDDGVGGYGYVPYYYTTGNIYTDWQSRPAQWGTKGTYYTHGGYLYEYTRKAQDGYWAVRATTNGKMDYLYGFTEVRMIAATDNGACSAVWLVTSGSNPGAENDVYENFGRDQLVCNLHYWGTGGAHASLDSSKNYTSDRRTYSMSDGSHLYDTFHYIGYEWSETAITYYVDGEAYLTVDTTVADTTISAKMMDVFRKPAWIKITNGIGAVDYGGNSRPANFSKRESDWRGVTKRKSNAALDANGNRTDGKYEMDSVEDFCETQLVDNIYIYQKNDGVSKILYK